MLSLPERLLKAVLAEPAADAPREILADYLEEVGTEQSVDRANLIRVMCRIARGERVPVPCSRCNGNGIYEQSIDPVKNKGSKPGARGRRRVVTYRAMPTEPVLCELCKHKGYRMRESPLRFEMAAIFKKWGKEWDAELVGPMAYDRRRRTIGPGVMLKWWRGFAEEMNCHFRRFIDVYPKLKEMTPIQHVNLHDSVHLLGEPFRRVDVIDPPGAYYKHEQYPGVKFHGPWYVFEIPVNHFVLSNG